MDSSSRRDEILRAIKGGKTPISAASIAKKLNVSRQVIVGDVALLRAQGHEIIATARGYMIPQFRETSQYTGKLVCCHAPENTREELYIIVDLNASVASVTVEHDLYGEIIGQLNLKDRNDVDIFIGRVEAAEVKLLSELTMGVHLHTIVCRDKAHFEEVEKALESAGYLYQG